MVMQNTPVSHWDLLGKKFSVAVAKSFPSFSILFDDFIDLARKFIEVSGDNLFTI